MEMQGPSRGVASVESRDTSSIVSGGLSICGGETREFLSDCFSSLMKYKARSSATSRGGKGGLRMRNAVSGGDIVGT